MELIFVLGVVAIVVWFWVNRASRNSTSTARTNTPELRFTVTTSNSSIEKAPIDVGEMTSAGYNAWVLNPKSPLALTVYNAEREVAKKLKELLGTTEYWSQKIPDMALLIAQHNLRFLEVDVFVAEHRSRFKSEVERLIAASTEWPDASEKDRHDLQAEYEGKAIESLCISVGHADLACLLEGEPSNFSEDDELLRKFGSDSNLYPFYLSALGRRSQVVTVKADEYSRKSWEQLVEKGFARRGKDISMQILLDGLRLKDLNELLSGTIEKPFGRKAKAIEAALNLPDLTTRLSERISYREMFQVVPPSGLNTEQLGNAFYYASTLATVVQQTYYTGAHTLEAIAERKRESGIYDAWEITNWEQPIPRCAAAMCKKHDRLPSKRPPFHVGCVCQLECSFKD